MDEYPIKIIRRRNLPPMLQEIPQPPPQLYVRGDIDWLGNAGASGTRGENDPKILCVVGSRRATSYGQMACEQLIAGLAGHNIVIVSGLALGIDSIAHRAALKAGLKTIAIPGSGLEWREIYPKVHYALAQEILESGGALVSPFPPNFTAAKYSFPQRNRIMAGLAHAVLVVEAREKSGTLITARLATEYNRDVGIVPGSIFSENSDGPHLLMRLGAAPICKSADLLELLRIETDTETENLAAENLLGTKNGTTAPKNVASKKIFNISHFAEKNNALGKNEKFIAKILKSPLTFDELVEQSKLSAQEVNIALSSLEIMKLVTIRGGIITPNIF